MILDWPQIIILVIVLIELGMAMEGERFLTSFLSSGIFLTLLYFGGFFTAGCAPTF